MKTTENNKLIVDFLEVEYSSNNETYCLPSFGFMNVKGDFQTDFTIGKLKFHSDWNWLMEVVEKIESLDFYKGSIIIQELKCTIYYDNKIICVKSSENSKIEAVYNGCIEFIKWYNQQNK